MSKPNAPAPLEDALLRQDGPGDRPTAITQAEVERLLVLRQEAQETQAVAAKQAAELAAEEDRLKALLQAGAPVERGPYLVDLVTELTGRSVAWRGVVEKELGKAFAEKVLADTTPGQRLTLRVLREVPGDGAAPGRGRGRGSQQDGR